MIDLKNRWLTIQCLHGECDYCFETYVGGWFGCQCSCHKEPDALIIPPWPIVV